MVNLSLNFCRWTIICCVYMCCVVCMIHSVFYLEINHTSIQQQTHSWCLIRSELGSYLPLTWCLDDGHHYNFNLLNKSFCFCLGYFQWDSWGGYWKNCCILGFSTYCFTDYILFQLVSTHHQTSSVFLNDCRPTWKPCWARIKELSRRVTGKREAATKGAGCDNWGEKTSPNTGHTLWMALLPLPPWPVTLPLQVKKEMVWVKKE